MGKLRKGRLKELLCRFKNPAFLLGFVFTWITLESPAICGVLFYWLTQDAKWLALFTSWVALTAAPLPIPVMPISISVACICGRIRSKIYGKKEQVFRSIKHFNKLYWFTIKRPRRVVRQGNCLIGKTM